MIGAVAYLVGPEAVTAYRTGFFSGDKKVSYSGNRADNLRRLYTAMMLYHESEGQFPVSSGWMDAIENRLQTNDLKSGEGSKKLKNPAFGDGPGVYGYAMNDEASAKYKDDLPEKDASVLLFESSDTKRNAHGKPSALAPSPPLSGGNLSVTVAGKLIQSKP